MLKEKKLAVIEVEASRIWPVCLLYAKDYVTEAVVAKAETSGFKGNSPTFTKICQDLDRKGYKLSEAAWDYAQAELRLDCKTFGSISNGTNLASAYMGMGMK